MRGEALGQYFTPRSIVKLMEKLASPIADRQYIDKVFDGCCGTGGFLIEALTDMREQIRNNTSLTDKERDELFNDIANESIFGIDAGRDPPIARIARINMYLHGDGGSRIYAADTLDKSVSTYTIEDQQAKFELEELKLFLIGDENTNPIRFDYILTNPPFSMDYSENLPDELRILKQYDLATYELEESENRRASLKSSIMFMERYADLLKEGGKLITIIDDSILSGKKYRYARNFIRKRFIVRSVISLPGDAFQRVGSRVKTSILLLEKCDEGDKSQPDVFMFESEFIGLDDVPTKTPPSKAAEAKFKAQKEIDLILQNFQKYLRGEKESWLVPASAISDRLDVKWCLPRQKDIVDEWIKKGIEVTTLEQIVDNITEGGFNPKDYPDTIFTLLRITYEGLPERGETRLGKELTYNYVLHPKENDIVTSNIAVSYGSTAVIPKKLEDTIISSEFTIMRIKNRRFDPMFLWGYFRSPEVRARLLSKSTGISRHRGGWDAIRTIPIPILDEKIQKKIGENYKLFIQKIEEAKNNREKASSVLDDMLHVTNEWAIRRLKTAKPPK
jgi:type I restriction enzyme M protein